MEFKEIIKKNGKVIIFCDFEDLLKEASGYDNIEEAVENLPGNQNEIICHCPFCKAEGHTKHKLYIKRDMTVGNCFVCGRAFIHTTNELRVDYNIPTFSKFNKEIVLPNFLNPKWNLDTFNCDFEDSDSVGEAYLSRRHPYLLEISKLLGFKYINGNIAIPFRYKGEIIYYQIRFSNPGKIKYFFPPVDNKPVYLLDFCEGKRDLIICEGVFDAIALMIQAPDYLPIAILGSSISDYQLNYLREYIPTSITIMMDETSISKKIFNKIKSVIDYCPINIIPTYGEDPEEILNKKISSNSELQWIKKSNYDRIETNRFNNFGKFYSTW